MKLIIQIPCYNEENTLKEVINDLPRQLEGIDVIEYLVIDDGSSDKTVQVAQELGVHHILSLGTNRGLAYAFLAGIERCLDLGADIIVNTDGDNQYNGHCIGDLIRPVAEGKLDIVIGARPIEDIEHFSWLKKKLQRAGSKVVRQFSGTNIPDTTSGFRAYSARAAMRLHVFNRYTYTLETIIQAGRKEIPITHVEIGTNEKLRESRLIKSIPSYITRSIATMLRVYLMYEPMKFFIQVGSVILFLGGLLGMRYMYFFFFGVKRGGHLQSLILAAVLLLSGFILVVAGLLADVIAANRKLNEEILYRLKKDKRA